MSLYEFWTRCLLHSRCYWGKEETMEGKQTLNVKFRNGSVGNCMLKIRTSRTFFCTKTFINFSTVAFWCFLKVGFATRLFIRTAYLLVNQKKKRQVQRISIRFLFALAVVWSRFATFKRRKSEEFSVYSNEWSPCTVSSFHSWAQSLEWRTALSCSFWSLGVAESWPVWGPVASNFGNS